MQSAILAELSLFRCYRCSRTDSDERKQSLTRRKAGETKRASFPFTNFKFRFLSLSEARNIRIYETWHSLIRWEKESSHPTFQSMKMNIQ